MTNLDLLDNFAKNIEIERIKLGYSQQEFAKLLNISSSTYKNIISRRTSSVDITLVPKIYSLTGRLLFELLELDTSCQIVHLTVEFVQIARIGNEAIFQ